MTLRISLIGMPPVRGPRHSARPPRTAIAVRWSGAVGVVALTASLLVSGVTAANAVTARPNLGFANSYVVLGNSAVTISDAGKVEGTFGADLGVSSPTGVYTNTGTLVGVGAINLNNAAAQRAQADLTAAHTAALAATGDYILPGELAGKTLRPGIHTADSNVTLTGTVTLDAQNDPDAIFIMVPHGAFDTAANARVVLANDAQAGNVYWFIGAAFTIGADADFSGRVIGGTAGTLSAGSTLHGQLLTTGTAITLSAAARIINDAPSGTATTDWSDQTLATMADGVEYKDGLTVVSSDGEPVGAEDVAWALTAGRLPPGINLDPVAGTLAGKRTDSDSYTWTITAIIVGHIRISKSFSTNDVGVPIVMITGGDTLLTNDTTPTISGTTDAEDGVNVAVVVGGATVSSTVMAGAWSVDLRDLGADGAYSVVVTITVAGVAGTARQTITLDATAPSLVIAGGSTVTVRDRTPTISGMSDAHDGTDVTIIVAGQSLLATVVGGVWSVTAADLTDGAHTITASVRDMAGNRTTANLALTLDSKAPSVVIGGGAAVITGDRTPTISGTTDALVGTLVSVTVAGQTLTASVDGGGVWSVTAADLTDGAHTITASVQDVAGNTGTATQTYRVVVAPDVAVTGGGAAASNNPAPTFVGTSTATVGSTVTVMIDGQILTTTVTAAGTWSVASADISTDGEYTVAVTVVDLATNISAYSAQIFTIDTTAPVVAVTVAPTGRTRNTTPTLSGTTDAPVGAILSVTVGGQVLSATVQVGGIWTVEPGPLDDGIVVVVVTAEDAYGNARSARQSFIVATTPPANTTLAQTVTEGAFESLVVTGTDFDPGESVQVWMHSLPVLLSTVTADQNGSILTSVTVPASTTSGLHHVVMIGVSSSTAQLSSETITVINSGTGTVRAAVVAQQTIELARTGTETIPVGGAALLLFLIGVLLLVLRLRTRNAGRQISP